MADPKSILEIALGAAGGIVATLGVIYTANRNGKATEKNAETTEKVADGNNVASAFSASQQMVQFWADKYGEVVTLYATVVAVQASQATEIEGLKKAIQSLSEEKTKTEGKLTDCEQREAALLARAIKAEDERSDFKNAFDALVMMTQMSAENKADKGLLNVAEERIRTVLEKADKQA